VLEALRGTVPETEVSAEALEGEESLVDALVASGLCSSRGDARRTIGGGGVSVNGVRQDGDATRLADGALVGGRYVLLQKGKRSRHLLVAG
jgi:tyrosyl-tRNA synthetase